MPNPGEVRARAKGTLTWTKTKPPLRQGIITLPDGRRHRLKPFPKGTSELVALEKTAYYSEHPEELDLPDAPTPTTEEYDADTTASGVWFNGSPIA